MAIADQPLTLSGLRATGMPIRKVREHADLVRAGASNEAERFAAVSMPMPL